MSGEHASRSSVLLQINTSLPLHGCHATAGLSTYAQVCTCNFTCQSRGAKTQIQTRLLAKMQQCHVHKATINSSDIIPEHGGLIPAVVHFIELRHLTLCSVCIILGHYSLRHFHSRQQIFRVQHHRCPSPKQSTCVLIIHSYIAIQYVSTQSTTQKV